jgi:general secretion pathway protein A
MYMRFFGLNRLPFEASPDPGFLFDGPAHREAIASIEYAVATRMGFIMLTGEVGLGKTTVIRAFLDRYDRDRLLPIYVFHPLLSFDDLLELVSDELGLTLAPGTSSFNRLRAIQRELIRLYEAEQQVILVIDEAQRLPEDTLENLRLLTNLETNQAKLLQIVLVGQPELEAILAQPHLRQLDQRIVLKARLDNLTPDDSMRYLRHRLILAGTENPEQVLSAGALHAIVELSQGVPRRMNILANRALIDAFGADEKPVGAPRVRRVAANAIGREKPRSHGTGRWRSVGIRLSIGLAAGLVMLWPTGPAPLELGSFAFLFNFLPRSEVAAPATPDLVSTRSQVAAVEETFTVVRQSEPSPAPRAILPDVLAPVPTILASAPSAPGQEPLSPTAQRAVLPDVPTSPVPTSATPPVPPPSKEPARPAALPAAWPEVLSPPPWPPVRAPAPARETASLEAPLEPGGAVLHDVTYMVVPGDTLWKICLVAYGPDIAPSMISKIMSRNRIISDIRLLYGKTIILPSSKNG